MTLALTVIALFSTVVCAVDFKPARALFKAALSSNVVAEKRFKFKKALAQYKLLNSRNLTRGQSQECSRRMGLISQQLAALAVNPEAVKARHNNMMKPHKDRAAQKKRIAVARANAAAAALKKRIAKAAQQKRNAKARSRAAAASRLRAQQARQRRAQAKRAAKKKTSFRRQAKNRLRNMQKNRARENHRQQVYRNGQKALSQSQDILQRGNRNSAKKSSHPGHSATGSLYRRFPTSEQLNRTSRACKKSEERFNRTLGNLNKVGKHGENAMNAFTNHRVFSGGADPDEVDTLLNQFRDARDLRQRYGPVPSGAARR